MYIASAVIKIVTPSDWLSELYLLPIWKIMSYLVQVLKLIHTRYTFNIQHFWLLLALAISRRGRGINA